MEEGTLPAADEDGLPFGGPGDADHRLVTTGMAADSYYMGDSGRPEDADGGLTRGR